MIAVIAVVTAEVDMIAVANTAMITITTTTTVVITTDRSSGFRARCADLIETPRPIGRGVFLRAACAKRLPTLIGLGASQPL